MTRKPVLPEIGRIVEIIRGREQGSFGVVVGHEAERFVLVADGDKRRIETPKKKNVLHVRNMPHISDEVLDILNRQGKITNASLRHALRQYQKSSQSRDGEAEEGSVPDG